MKKHYLMTLVVIFACGAIYGQNLIRVNNNPDIDADYTSLQDANDNASNGDTIYIEGSVTEYDGADITKSLTIIGPGFFLSENPNTQANGFEADFGYSDISFKTGSEGSIITGCKCSKIEINVDNITVKRCNASYIQLFDEIENILICQNYVTTYIYTGTSSSDIITNSIISNNIVEAKIQFNYLCGALIISNNVITKDNHTYGIFSYNSTIQNNIIVGKDSKLETYTGNTINNNLLARDGTNAGGNQYNIDMSLVFKDPSTYTSEFSTDGRWQLKTGSPAIDAGLGDVDCGAFGGGVAPYILSGIPDLPHIYEATVPATANSTDGISVTIKVKSGN